MQQRLCGREQEFGMGIIPKKNRNSGNFEQQKDILISMILTNAHRFAPTMNDRHGERCWLANGSMMYEDGSLLEVATAEGLAGSLDIVLQEKASEWILNKIVRRIEKSKKFKNLKHVALYKNNVGLSERCPTPHNYMYEEEVDADQSSGSLGKIDFSKEATYGCHQNYSYDAKRKKEVQGILRSFIPAALPLSGNGHILRLKNKCIFGFSQRAPYIHCAFSQDVGSGKAVINTRDESLMDSQSGLKRLHIISRDATRCEFQTWLVDSITHLVLRLAEEGWRLPKRFHLLDPAREMRCLNQHLDLNYKVNAESGLIDVIEYNHIFLKAARQLRPLSKAEKHCLEEWARILDLLKARAWRKLVGELDWATKRFLLAIKMRQHNFSLDSFIAWRINMNYHDISASPKHSWFARLEESGHIKHLVSKDQIKRAVITPPKTRAMPRGKLVQLCLKHPRIRRRLNVFDWGSASFYDYIDDGPDDFEVIFGEKNNPCSFTSSTLERFCERFKIPCK